MWIIKLILFFIGALLFFDGIFALFITGPNMGNVLLTVLSVPVFVCALFFEILCKNTFTLVLMFIAALAYILFFAFIAGLSLFLHRFGLKQHACKKSTLIVLGMGLKGEEMLPTLKLRLDGAAEYLKANVNSVAILSGGIAKHSSKTEAQTMKEYLVSVGVDEKRLILENEAKSTEENFRFSKRILKELSKDESECVFLTNIFHVFRSQKTARALGMNINGIGVKDAFYIAPNNYLRECAAIVQYVIKGKMKL